MFADLPEQTPEEITLTLLEAKNLRIERIVSNGQASPEGFWYDQSQHEWVLLLSGSAGLQIDGEPELHLLGPGDFLLIPAGQRHRVAWTEAGSITVWLAVFFS